MLDKIQVKFHSIYGFRTSMWGSIYLGQSKNPVINLYFKSTLSLEILIKILTTSAAAQNTQLAQHTGRTRQIYFWLACIYCLHKYNGHRKKDLQFAFPLYISHTIQLLSGNTSHWPNQLPHYAISSTAFQHPPPPPKPNRSKSFPPPSLPEGSSVLDQRSEQAIPQAKAQQNPLAHLAGKTHGVVNNGEPAFLPSSKVNISASRSCLKIFEIHHFFHQVIWKKMELLEVKCSVTHMHT